MNTEINRWQIAQKLREVAGEDASLEARFLVEYTKSHPESDLRALLERRLSGEPLQYVLGEWEFWGLPFTTDPRALIPRPDTEILVETALSFLRGGERVLDLCCGSGCIGISIAHSVPVELISADISEAALSLTRENAKKNGVALTTAACDLFEGIEGSFDLIVCNPPYLDETEMSDRDASMRYEPENALYGGPDGLSFYRRIRKAYAQHLNTGGILILEIGYSQREAILELFPTAKIRYDYGNRPRCAVVRKDD